MQIKKTLLGDRDIEWGFCAFHLAALLPKTVLDVGCDIGLMSRFAAERGAKVVGVDLVPQVIDCPGVEFRHCRAEDLEPELMFDCIVSCSTIEHVGLAGRYGSEDAPDGDLSLMRHLLDRLNPDGVQLLTCPVGVDAVHSPLHRVYGKERLPRLLEGWRIKIARYHAKDDDISGWRVVDRERALSEVSSPSSYALGCFILGKGE